MSAAHRCWPNDGLLNGFRHIGVKAGDFDHVQVIVASNLPVLAHDFERTVHFVGESAQIKRCRYSVLELDHGDLMVAHIIVKPINTAPVRTRCERLEQSLFALIRRNDGSGPLSPYRQIGFSCIESAVCRYLTVEASFRTAFRCILRFKISQAP